MMSRVYISYIIIIYIILLYGPTTIRHDIRLHYTIHARCTNKFILSDENVSYYCMLCSIYYY